MVRGVASLGRVSAGVRVVRLSQRVLTDVRDELSRGGRGRSRDTTRGTRLARPQNGTIARHTAGGERADGPAGRQVAGQLRPCGGEGRRSFGQFVAARRLDEFGLVLWKFDSGLVGV